MKLLVRSTMRHIKHHFFQTILTMSVTILITAILSVLFLFASGFQSLLREYALNNTGSYHYRYAAPGNSDSAEMLRRMAETFAEDSWFSEVILAENASGPELFLTVSHPGIFMSKMMDRKFDRICRTFTSGSETTRIIEMNHNYELLVSYGDLDKRSGMYSFLLVFFVMLAIIALASVLTLGAVFQVSASRREREFALYRSVGADGRQIKAMMLSESIFYLCFSVPVGYLVGILFFEMSRRCMDDLLMALGNLPPIKLVISVPFSVSLILCVIGIILFCGFRTAVRAVRISPMEMLQRTGDLMVSPKEFVDISMFKKWFGIEWWMALRSHGRFRRRYRPVLLALSVAFALCFVAAGFRRCAAEVIEIIQKKHSYNISIDLYCDDPERLDSLAGELAAAVGYELQAVREARFELHSPYPFSGTVRESGLAGDTSMLPDVLLVSVDEKYYLGVCEKLSISPNGLNLGEEGPVQGIFVDTEKVWVQDDIFYKGRPFSLQGGDVVSIYQNRDSSEQEKGIPISIVGVMEEALLYVDEQAASRLVLLIPESAFLQLEGLRPFSGREPGIHHLSLRGFIKDAYRVEKQAAKILDAQETVTGSIVNSEESMRRERTEIQGFQYLCSVLILLLGLVCLCGNFTVSWTVRNTRRKEFAALVSVGMGPGELWRMRCWELLFNVLYSFFPGLAAGLLCYWFVFRAYSAEYHVAWYFPWDGLLAGLILLCLAGILTELAQKMSERKMTVADLLRIDGQ